MAERIADDADLAVDELKRRARRRLIGAIVLALAAAVILPLLLEKDPKPLGDDVSVQIPPVDEGRFVNRLTGRAGDAKSAQKSDARPLPKSAPAKIEPPAAAPAAPETSTPAAPAEGATSATPAPTDTAPPRKSVAEAEQKVLAGGKAPVAAKPEARVAAAPAAAPAPTASPPPAPAPAPTPAALPTSAPTPPKAEGFAVQIAAFTDDKGANALAGKLRKAGYEAAYTEPVETSRGTLWRVRVGGFATRQDADAARAKLKGDGWNGLVVPTK